MVFGNSPSCSFVRVTSLVRLGIYSKKTQSVSLLLSRVYSRTFSLFLFIIILAIFFFIYYFFLLAHFLSDLLTCWVVLSPNLNMAMASGTERPTQFNNNGELSGRSTDGQIEETVSTTPARRTASEAGMSELPRPTSTIKRRAHTQPQVPRLSSPVSAPASTTDSIVSSRETSPVRDSLRAVNLTSVNNDLSRSRQSSRSRERSSPRLGTRPFEQKTPLTTTTTTTEPPFNEPGLEKSNMAPWTPGRRTFTEQNQPNMSSKRSAVLPVEEQSPDHTPKAESHPWDRSTPRAVGRVNAGGPGSLETVQEMASDPSTPSADTIINMPPPDEPRLQKIEEDPQAKASRQNVESGSESSGNNRGLEMREQPRRQPSGTRPRGDILPKRSTTSLSGSRGKPTDGSVRNMIVETETVSSIPQVSLATVTGDRGVSGRTEPNTLRMKPSTETIRPKREKKRTRKPAAAASSKADIFEAKIASAVDEADVSDSDETFVYESNPPDPYPARQHRYHSRTPSTTSMASQAEQYTGRPRPGLRDGNHSVTGKRSMKFTNNTYNGSSVDGDAGDVDGGGRGNSRVDGSTTPRHLHIGRHGRSGMYPSLFDSDSPFDQAQPPSRSPRHFPGFRRERHGGSRAVPNYRTMGGSKKTGDAFGYDYDAEGADDERTPLVTPRPTRSRHGRRPNSAAFRHMEHMRYRERGFLFRYGACIIISLLLLLLVGGSTTFIVAVTKPLLDLEVNAIQNVLASEQEIMLDLNVQAVNPNLFPVAVDDLDVNIFARSRFVGTDNAWRDRSQFPREEHIEGSSQLKVDITRCLGRDDDACREESSSGSVHIADGVDRGTDPINPTDPVGDSQTMLLGRVFLFDSPIIFEPSPWNHVKSISKGQIRLARPGNKTEEGGTERWERVLQHPFELIVRGVVKYQLALSSRIYSSPISSSVQVIPNDDNHQGNSTTIMETAIRDLPSPDSSNGDLGVHGNEWSRSAARTTATVPQRFTA